MRALGHSPPRAQSDHRRSPRNPALVLISFTALALVFGAGACGKSRGTPPVAGPLEVRFYGTDGNMLNSVGARISGDPTAMAGMKGTLPATELPASFTQRLGLIDQRLRDTAYTGESYDAVVISALAAEIAHSGDPKAIAAQINGVTTVGAECGSPRDCLDLIHAGTDIAYRGISLRLGGFTDAGEPAAGTYAIMQFGLRNSIEEGATQYLPIGDPSRQTSTRPPRPTMAGRQPGPLKIGALLPHTGDMSSAGPPMFAGAQLGVLDVNQAGGVLGRPVLWLDGDDGTNAATAKTTAQRLIDAGVQVIIGAGSSSTTISVLPTILAAGLVLFSPCNTAAALSTIDDHG
jgi:Periplasmic binding protein